MQMFLARKKGKSREVTYKDVPANNRQEAARKAEVPLKDVFLNNRKH